MTNVTKLGSEDESNSSYQRYRDAEPIEGASNSDYTIQEDDLYHTITFEVTPQNTESIS